MRGAEPVLLEGCSVVYTSFRRAPLTGVDICIEDGGIRLGSRSGCRSGTVLNCRGYVVTPCFYNAYVDPLSIAARVKGSVEGVGLDAQRLCLELSAIEMLLSGTCGALTVLSRPQLARDVGSSYGLRLSVAAPPSSAAAEGWDAVFVDLTPETPRDLLLEAHTLAGERGAVLLIRASVDRRSVFLHRRRRGAFPVEWLDRVGVLDSRVVLAGLSWVTSWELEAVRRSGAAVVVCPSLYAFEASGSCFPLRRGFEEGLRMAMGSCGIHANTPSVLSEVFTALLSTRLVFWDKDTRPEELLAIASEGSSKVVGIGCWDLAEGGCADLLLFPLRSPATQPPSPMSFISALSTARLVPDYVFIGGAPVVTPEKRRVLTERASRLGVELLRALGLEHQL